MGSACTLRCTKYMVYGFTVLFWMTGVAILAIGIWVRVEKSKYDSLIGSDLYPIGGYILIGAGSVALGIGFAGFCGALKEHKILLGTYFGLLFLIFAAEVAASIVSYMLFDEVRLRIDARLNYTMKNEYGYKQFKMNTLAIDVLQQEFQCCGDLAYTSWLHSQYIKDPLFDRERHGCAVPTSCCIRPTDPGCNVGFPAPTKMDKIYTEGCLPRFEMWIKDNLLIVGGVSLGIAMVQLIGMAITCCMYKAVDDKEELQS